VRSTPQLITYADRFAGDLEGLHRLLDGPLAGAFAGVHVLPFFVPIDGADAGFDPIDHTAVDPRVGTWDDVGALAAHRELMADLIVNHISVASAEMADWLAIGDESPHAELFLAPEAVFGHVPTADDIAAIYRPRPTPPFRSIRLADGSERLVWTTFTADQIDIDVESAAGWGYLLGILDRLAGAGVAAVRLDAVGYAIKRAGTSCFMIPETFEFIERLSAACHERGIDVLVEVHSHHQDQVDIAARVDWVYDFALPPLLLDAFAHGDARPLKRWIGIRPNNAVNVLDTHDGIGVIDVGPDLRSAGRHGLLEPDRIDRLVETIHGNSGGSSRLATGAAASNLDLYQVNCTYFDALGGNEAHYLAARTLQLLLPGVPQIYYVGLLAGSNDMELLARTGVGRDVNRHHYTPDEVTAALARPVVRALLDLLRWRMTEPAFDGTFELLDSADHEVAVRWTSAVSTIERTVDLRTGAVDHP